MAGARPEQGPAIEAEVGRQWKAMAASADLEQVGRFIALFGSVGPQQIVDALRDARDLRIDKRKVLLEHPIRELGTFMVEIDLGDGNVASVKTIISEEK